MPPPPSLLPRRYPLALLGRLNDRIARTGDGELKRTRLSTEVLPSLKSPVSPIQAIGVLATLLSLTPRQAEVLHWVAEGKTNSEISIILECSFFTVKTHLKEIFQRLGVHSRTGAAAYAYRAHIAEADALRAVPKANLKRA